MHLLDSYSLTGERSAEIYFLFENADPSAVGFRDRDEGRLIDIGGLHIESFVWTLMVKLADESIKLGLLLKEVGASRARRFDFQGSMHAFVTAVLLRMAGLNALDGDAEAEPPNGKPAQIAEIIGRGEGYAVVGANGLRRAALLE